MDRTKLGDYDIVKLIGKGTLGTVYLAEHRFIKRTFVLKVLPEELASDRGFISRFEHDVAHLAKLDHPHIVKVHNVSFADGVYFLVLDCIVDSFGETTNLAQYIGVNKQKLNENEILDLLRQVASALDYAHQKEQSGKAMVHRGIKLNNILIGKGDRGLHVLLSDFGLSRIVGEGQILNRTYQNLAEMLSLDEGVGTGSDRYFAGQMDSSKLSKLQASFLQSYHFLAPEQKIFRETPVGPSVDIYAFGVLAYFLLLHTYPEGLFPLPSQLYPDYRLNWDLLMHQCLQADPTKRPALLEPLLEEIVQPRLEQSELNFWKGEQEVVEKRESKAPPPSAPPPVAVMEKTEQATIATPVEKIQELLDAVKPQPVIKPQEIQRPTYEPDPGAIFHVESNVAPYKPKEKEHKEVQPLLSDMVVIKGGEFYRGSNQGGRDERPHHKIWIDDFALDVTPITNEQFVLFLETMGGEKDTNNQDIIRLKDSRIKRMSGKYTIESGYNKHPVVGVTWYGSVAYAKWIGKRLPTEAEWEIASRGGLVDAQYPTGATIERSQANFFSADTTVVKSYPPNGYGIYDMAGNVYEWCQDWYEYNYYDESMQEPENPKGPIQGVYRVLRGGCWKSLKEDLRSSHRHRNNPGTVNRTYGFRCAADVTSS